MKTAAVITLVAVFVLAGLSASIYYWWSQTDIAISVHGLIALILGCVVSLALGGGLMFLVFYSNRRGYDDEHHQGPQDG